MLPCSFTSVAFAHSASPEVVSLVQKWPNAVNNSSAYQVPTEVLYINTITRQKLWGYEITTGGRGSGRGGSGGGSGASTNVLKWFKLLLQERPTGPIRAQGPAPQPRSPPGPDPPSSSSGSSGDNSSGLESLFGGLGIAELSSTFMPPSVTPAQRTAGMLQKANLTPVAVVTDFLKAVRETALASIEGAYGSEWTLSTHKEYMLTVPAIWSDAAKSLMVQAAQDAGFGIHRVDFNLISEPEAAAAYTLRAIQPNNLEVSSLTPWRIVGYG